MLILEVGLNTFFYTYIQTKKKMFVYNLKLEYSYNYSTLTNV